MKKFCARKIIIFLLFLISICPVFSASWFELDSKSFVDAASIKYENNYVYAWFKDLNRGNFSPIDNVKIHYVLNYVVFDCNESRYKVLSLVAHGVNGKILYDDDTTSYFHPSSDTLDIIVPDSSFEQKREIMCKLKAKEQSLYNK